MWVHCSSHPSRLCSPGWFCRRWHCQYSRRLHRWWWWWLAQSCCHCCWRKWRCRRSCDYCCPSTCYSSVRGGQCITPPGGWNAGRWWHSHWLTRYPHSGWLLIAASLKMIMKQLLSHNDAGAKATVIMTAGRTTEVAFVDFVPLKDDRKMIDFWYGF